MLSQNELANAIDISQALYSQIENGNRRCTDKNLEKICKFYNISTLDFKLMDIQELYEQIWMTIKNTKRVKVPYTDLSGNVYKLTLN